MSSLMRSLVVELLEKIVKLGLQFKLFMPAGRVVSVLSVRGMRAVIALQHGNGFTLKARPWRTILSLAFEASNFLVLASRSTAKKNSSWR